MVPSTLEQRLRIAGEALRQAVARARPRRANPGRGRAAAGSTLLARRVEDGEEWRRAGYRSAADFLAAKTGSSLGAARRKVDDALMRRARAVHQRINATARQPSLDLA